MLNADDDNTTVTPQTPRNPLERGLVAPYLDDGLCLFHRDLLPMDCTLVARLGCLGCIYSRRNLDPIELPDAPPTYGQHQDQRPIWDSSDA